MRRLVPLLFGKDSRYAREPLGLLAGLVIVAIWSAWYIVSRIGLLGSLTPGDITFIRYVVGSACALPLLWLWRASWRNVPWRQLPVLVLCYGFPYTMALFIGLQETPAANAGVLLNGLLPAAAAGCAWLASRQGVGWGKLLAIGVLLLSNVLMFYAGLGGGKLSIALLWIIVATLLLAVYLTATRLRPVDIKVLLPAMSLGNLLLFLPLWPWLPSGLADAGRGEILLQAIFQGVVNQFLVVWLISYAIARIGSVSIAVLYGIVPALTAILGWLFLSEELRPLEIVAIIGCCAGIAAFARAR